MFKPNNAHNYEEFIFYSGNYTCMYDALLALSFLHKREPNIIYLSVVITDSLHPLTTNYNCEI